MLFDKVIQRVKNRPKIFYGWWIVLASTITNAIAGGFYFYGFSAFFMPLAEEFKSTRAAISGVFSLSRMEGGFLAPVSGFLVDRFGPRRTMLLGIALMGTGFILLSRITSLVAFYIVFVLVVEAGHALAIRQAPLVPIVNWFVRKRGIALGLAMTGSGLGGALVPFVGWLIAEHGWRYATVAIGIIVWGVGIPAAMVMRHRPEQYGCLPDGETPKEKTTDDAKAASAVETSNRAVDEEVTFTPRQVLKMAVFWLLVLAFGLRQFALNATLVHQVPYLIGLGFAPEMAATILGSIAIISIVGRLGFGRLADVIEKRYVMAICIAFIGVGNLLLVFASEPWHVIPFLIIFGPAYGGGATVMEAIRADYFGRRHYGTIMGFMNLFQVFGVVLAPVFAGWIYDVYGSYQRAFVTFAIAAGVAMVFMLLARRPVPKPQIA